MKAFFALYLEPFQRFADGNDGCIAGEIDFTRLLHHIRRAVFRRG